MPLTATITATALLRSGTESHCTTAGIGVTTRARVAAETMA